MSSGRSILFNNWIKGSVDRTSGQPLPQKTSAESVDWVLRCSSCSILPWSLSPCSVEQGSVRQVEGAGAQSLLSTFFSPCFGVKTISNYGHWCNFLCHFTFVRKNLGSFVSWPFDLRLTWSRPLLCSLILRFFSQYRGQYVICHRWR